MMEEFIKKFLEKHGFTYYRITNPFSLKLVYDLYCHGSNESDCNTIDDIVCLYFGIYYGINKNYKQMKKYYLKAIEKENHMAMYNLGNYYQYIEKDYGQMKKYYQMAIEKGSSVAMNNLGFYFQHVEKNYKQMKKYYLMAIEKDDIKAMNKIGLYYQYTKKDYNKMKKYYLMAIGKNNINAMYYLGSYYDLIEKDYYQMEKYYLMIMDTENNYRNIINKLESYYRTNNNTHKLLKLYIKINDSIEISKILIEYSNQTVLNEEINHILLEYLNSIDNTLLPVSLKLYKQLLNKQVDLLEAHFKYTENGLGFSEAKKDFYQQLSFCS